MITYDAWSDGAHCRHCQRLVAKGSAHEEGGLRCDAHWDCARRARLEQRARDAEPSASERSLRGRIGAYTRWANTGDRYTATRAMREGFYAKFEREVDPEGKLTPGERAKRAEYARKAHMQRMALKSAQVRRRRRQP
ncbi:hypothetical protein [Mycobacterium stomatepiae]|uniref:Uncharacterized protein n=1 Tax=Mycobacterium stomatepiae TaxID=470076 RepID=A0A7I7Q5K6_9MYCO|nr:hypothetical protein [Mycobacterium stomatepiae]MCV7163281.1 hypothetical protein [Mycobacterium stomatepiae]BBY21296.1 hypothetical protein MSTO_15010 [Mycobacterium stomatepiae]